MLEVRQVGMNDLSRLAEVEELRWGRIAGAPSMTYDDLLTWYETGSPHFYVATEESTIIGYSYAVPIQFDFSEESIARFVSSSTLISHGIAEVECDTKGNAVYSMSVTSLKPQAAEALHRYAKERYIKQRLEYIIGVSRLGLFNRYRKSADLPVANKKSLARWYALESLRLINGTSDQGNNHSTYPPVRRPDPVLRYNAHGLPFNLLEIVDMMPEDSNSDGLGAVIISRYPHTLQ